MKNRKVVTIQISWTISAGQLSEAGVVEDSLYFNMRKSIQILHNVNLKTVKSTLLKRVLTDVSAMLPSSLHICIPFVVMYAAELNNF